MQSPYRFGRAELRPVERELRIDGEVVAVGGRALDLLLALIERRERVVAKDELLDLVWPGLVVEEHNLYVQINTLRKVLGAQVIVTIPGRGYRFTLPTNRDDASIGTREPRVCNLSLPASVSVLIGRDDDLGALKSALAEYRLITVVGAGGVGKTALALAAAQFVDVSHRDGVAWVDLARVSDPALLVPAVAQALGLPVGPGNAPLAALVAGLAALQILIVLDNAEHLREEVAQLSRAVIEGTREAKLLVTSQTPLKIEGESVFRLDPLSVPEDGATAAQALNYGSVALFVERARASDRRFELGNENVQTVISLCRDLDGLPLAIRLAAARVGFLGLKGLYERLPQRLNMLAGGSVGAPERQRTVGAAFDWSYGLLSDKEQRTFRKLGVFVGGFTLELAAALAGDDVADEWTAIDVLASLVDRSLVSVERLDPPRYRLLESARAYALFKLEGAGELHETRHRHARALQSLLETADEEIWYKADAVWLACYAPELDNLRAALDWSAAHAPGMAVALIAVAPDLFFLLGLRHEYRRRSTALGPLLENAAREHVAKYWLARSRAYRFVSNEAMHECALKAVQRFRELGDELCLWHSLACLVFSWLVPSDVSDTVLDEMNRLQRRQSSPRLRALCYGAESDALSIEERYAEARRAAEAGLAVAREGGFAWLAALRANQVIAATQALGEVDEAVRLSAAAVEQAKAAVEQAHRSGGLAISLATLAIGLVLQGNLAAAREILSEFFTLCRSAEWDPFDRCSGCDLCTSLALREGRFAAVARLLGYSDATWERIGGRPSRAAKFRAWAWVSLEAAMDATTIERLMAEGAELNEEAICALTMEHE